ncbi:MAG TPA: GNAT family N-acetyltransferase [Solirubrobacteraceae bacterium]|nr:GNAT family N-acetyltransferase [Solirubrobacteraceae bacterium]
MSAEQVSSPQLREQLLDMWVRVTDAGGAVGFVPPADPEAIGRLLDSSLARVAAGTDVLGVLRRDGVAVGMGFLVASASPLRGHWRTVLRLMVAPELQGSGLGRTLLEGLHGLAAELGLDHLLLTVRGGLGIEGFYEHLGYAIVGRHPRAIRIAAGDDRDELTMMRRVAR